MNKKINFRLFIVLAMLLALIPSGFAAAAGAVKVDVCHLDELGLYHQINISENAFDTHVAHGDASPLEWVPGMTGYKFGADCSLVAIPQKTLVDTVKVYPNGTPVPSNISLFAGQLYELKASGTFTYTSNVAVWADAEWYLRDGIIVKDVGSKVYVLDISINGYTTNTDWGDYNPAHIYYQTITGAGLPVDFRIYDSAYGDNGGFLTVEIYQFNW